MFEFKLYFHVIRCFVKTQTRYIYEIYMYTYVLLLMCGTID